MVLREVFLVCLIVVLFNFCSSSENDKEEELASRKELNDKIYNNKNEDSLLLMLEQFTQEGNHYGVMLCHKQLGLYMRENARFIEAIDHHQEGLNIAIKLKDTIEIVQAYNNLGTDFRRIGSQGEAADFHFSALDYSEAYSQVELSRNGIKNRVVSLNGIGNIYLSLGYFDEAEQYFKKALEDEIKLESLIGQAINYANLGAIFEHRGQLDSARIYYTKSLENNQKAKSNMGIGLCHIHLGDLYEKEKEFTLAKEEYQKAYTLMEILTDKWHWLEACMSIARINLHENNYAEYNKYISLAENTAKEINSPEHLADIYLLKYDYEKQTGDYLQALDNYKLHTEMKDSVFGTQNESRFMEGRVRYERDKNKRQIARIEADSEADDNRHKLILNVLIAIIVLGGIMIGMLYYAYRQRSRSNKMLKEMERTRADFFANITNEFRTPLKIIHRFCGLLKSNNDLSDKSKNAYLATIDRQSDNMLNYVNQLLDVTKLKSGKQKPVWKKGDIISYLNMTAEKFEYLAEEKNVNLVFFSDVKELEMDFIPSYIDKIVGILIQNSVNHTQAGDRIDFVVVKGIRPDTIVIRISDTGEEISEEDLKHISDMFCKNDNIKNTSETDISLVLTRMMVEQMKGKIEVDSYSGKGNTIVLTLPVNNNNMPYVTQIQDLTTNNSLFRKKENHLEETPLEEHSIEEEKVEKNIVLVVEDNKDVRQYIKTLLSDNYTVIIARNGQEGLEMAEKHIPDLVITDLMMPEKDGAQLCCEMKENKMLNHIPVIMLTAKNDDKSRIKGLQCGAEAFINKPFNPEELFASINNLMKGRKLIIEKYKDNFETNLQETRNIKETDANLKYLQTVTDIIYKEIQNPALSSAFLAEQMGVSISQLNRKLNAITGQSTISYILKVKLDKAKKMLQDTPDSISYVADSCGFYDANYFSRVFKKEFGVTPTQFQKTAM